MRGIGGKRRFMTRITVNIPDDSEIMKSAHERSKIKATLFNIRIIFKDVRAYEKILNTPVLAVQVNEAKTREKINNLINEAVNELSDIDPLCQIYHELFAVEFQETNNALTRIIKRQKLVPCK